MAEELARSDASRLAREIAHHRDIADHAEFIWTWSSPSGQFRARRRALLFRQSGALEAGRRVLELGCGTGVFTELVAVSGATIVGIDLSVDLLARAATRVERHAHVSVSCGNAEAMPFPDASFDAVYGSSILHHLTIDAALRDVFRILRPGGRIVFAEPNMLNPQVAFMFNTGLTKKYFGVSPDERAFTRFAARRALLRAGFTDISVRPFDFVHPALGERLIPLVARLGQLLERTPVLREIAGSLLMEAARPA